MSVQSIEELAFGSSSFSDTAYSITVTYQVTVEDGDGPDTIRRDAFFRRGKAYAFRNDSNPALSLTRISNIRPDSGKRTRFFVDCEFSANTAVGGGSSGGGGGGGGVDLPPAPPNDDTPYQWPALGMEVRTAYFRKRAERAKFLGVYVQELGVRNKWSDKLAGVWDVYVGPPIHSNKKQVDPPPDYDESGFVFRQKGYWVAEALQRKLDLLKNLGGSINENPVKLSNPMGNMTFTAEPMTLRLDSVSIADSYGWDPAVPVDVEWVYKPGGWWEDIPDSGRVVTLTAEPVSAAGDAVAEMHADEAAIRDARGEVLSDESPLNGLGQINRSYDAQQYFNRWMLGPMVAEFPDFRPYQEAW